MEQEPDPDGLQQQHEDSILDFLRHEAYDLMIKLGKVDADGEWTDEGVEWLNAELDKPDGLYQLKQMLIDRPSPSPDTPSSDR
jgi:hypothetical protein